MNASGCKQDSREIVWVLAYLAARQLLNGKAQRVLEIGMDAGGWIRAMSKVTISGTLFVGVDATRRPEHAVLQAELAAEEKRLIVVHGFSQDVAVRNGVLKALIQATGVGDAQFDLLHIDGDHRPDAVKRDVALYLPMLEKDRVCLIHDIAGPSREAWTDLSAAFPRTGTILGTKTQMGIGVIYT